MILKNGFETPYNKYAAKKVLQRGSRINVHLSNRGPDMQGMYERYSEDKKHLVMKDVETDMMAEIPIHQCCIVLDGADHQTFRECSEYFAFGGCTYSLDHSKYAPKVRHKERSSEWKRLFGDTNDYTASDKLSKKEKKAQRRAQQRAQKREEQTPREKVHLPAFVE